MRLGGSLALPISARFEFFYTLRGWGEGPTRLTDTRSKDQLQHKLNAAGAAAIKKRTEKSAARFIGHLFGQSKIIAGGQQVVSRGGRCREVGMVEEIEKLGTILDRKFFVDLSVFQEAKIKLLETARAQNVAAGVSIRAGRRDSKCLWIGDVEGGEVGRNVQRLVRDDIGPLVVGGKLVTVAGNILSEEGRKRRAGL